MMSQKLKERKTLKLQRRTPIASNTEIQTFIEDYPREEMEKKGAVLYD